jgi:hypothetical protein
MKLITMTAAAALALAAPAFAYTGVSPSMLSSVENILEESGLSVDVTTLTDEQVVEVYVAGQQDTSAEQLGMIRSALDEDNYIMRPVTERRMTLTEADERGLVPVGENSIVASVQNYLERQNFEVDASTLTDAQIAEIYTIAFSAEDDAGNRDEIESILNM